MDSTKPTLRNFQIILKYQDSRKVSLVLFGEVMLTWDESASSTTRGASVNKVIMVPPIQRNSMVVPFNRDKTLKTMESLYESFVRRCLESPVSLTVGCAYEWLLNLFIEHTKPQQPITPEHKTKKAGSLERPRHFFSAQKLNMRNAP
jgi:hypothetical protein